MKDDMIDFPCSPTWRDWYWRQGLTRPPAQDERARVRVEIEKRRERERSAWTLRK